MIQATSKSYKLRKIIHIKDIFRSYKISKLNFSLRYRSGLNYTLPQGYNSSDPSIQSFRPSHNNVELMQCLLSHLKYRLFSMFIESDNLVE